MLCLGMLGMTDANMHLVTVDVKLPGGENKAPKPKLEAVSRVHLSSAQSCNPPLTRSKPVSVIQGEHIVQRLVEVSKLWETLQGASPSRRRTCFRLALTTVIYSLFASLRVREEGQHH